MQINHIFEKPYLKINDAEALISRPIQKHFFEFGRNSNVANSKTSVDPKILQ